MTTPDHAKKPTSSLDLPPELRNHIYSLVFEDKTTLQEIDIFAAKDLAPETNLSLTCRQIYPETGAMLSQAYAQFWYGHAFGHYLESNDLVTDVAGTKLWHPPAVLQLLLDKLADTDRVPKLKSVTVRVIGNHPYYCQERSHDYVFTADSNGKVTMADGLTRILAHAERDGIHLTYHERPQCLDLYNFIRAVYAHYGWPTADSRLSLRLSPGSVARESLGY